MRNINLEDRLIKVMARVSLDKVRPLLSVLETDLTRRFNYSSESKQAVKFTEKLIGFYGGIYLALKQTIKGNINNLSFESKYLNFVASEATSQRFGGNISSNYSTHTRVKGLNEVVKEMYNLASSSSSLSKIPININEFLRSNSSALRLDMHQPFFNQEKQEVLDWVVNGKGFNVVLKEQKQQKELSQENLEDHVKGLKEHNLIPVKKTDIFGNKESISLINDEIPCLLAYDSIEKRNPFFGFSSYLMFVGKPGTGKSMLARYAMTLGKTLAKKYQKPLSLVQLDIKDSWKNGSFLNLGRQFQEINQGNKIYMIFIDEIDKALTESNDSGAVEQFLRFRGGAEYCNKGNYIVISTTNSPEIIHKGIMRVFDVLEVNGPETPEEKINLLKHNLQGKFTKINSWTNIYSAFQKYELNGDEIFQIAERAQIKARRIARSVSLNGSATEIEKRVNELIQTGNPKYLTSERDVLEAISFQLKKEQSVRCYA